MTTQYSPILKLALPVTGELSGSWGDVVNDNITSMVEQAVAGLATINSWTTNSHTLTSANGTTSESRCAMLVLTDTGTALTGAATVVCPTATKLYIVQNSTGQTATIKTAAGTGVAVPNGQAMFVFCDGTNVVQAVTHIQGGSIDDTTVGATTASTGAFTTLDSSGATELNGTTIPASKTLATTDSAQTLTNKVMSSSDNTFTGLVIETADTGSAVVPSGTEAQRDGSPNAGYFRFNSDTSSFEGYNGTAWGSIGGGASGGGGDAVFYENGQNVTADYSITASNNAMSTGPITINSGVAVTIPSGSRWAII